MKSLSQLKSSFTKGLISKAHYIKKMHALHQLLFDYSDFIKDTDISNIAIADGQVIITMRSINAKFVFDKKNLRPYPLESLNFGNYERAELDLFVKFVPKKGIVFDVGANIGGNSVYFAKALKDVEVFSFEPIPTTFYFLKKNIQLNSLKNVYAFNFGFSDKSRIVSFFLNTHDPGSASEVNLNPLSQNQRVKVKLNKIDDFIKEKNIDIDAINCDAEGAECFVFQGGKNTIGKHKPIILVEMLRKWTAKFGYHPNDTIALFSKFGYQSFELKKQRLKKINTMTEKTVSTNFFFLHKKKHKKLIDSFSL